MKKFKIEKLVLATNNKHKVKEIKAILEKSKIRTQIFSLDRFPHIKPTIEDRNTIEGNAAKKAREVAQQTGFHALADDTGLFISALKGDPGVYSARFAGRGCNFQDNNRKVLRLMKKIPSSKRDATFRCIAALANPEGKVVMVKGHIRGKISDRMRGDIGFGYDPIFYVPKYKKTFAEMNLKLKNAISHRGKAFSKISVLFEKMEQKPLIR